jgi:predicted amidophosphoribosyltransferase
MRYKMTHRDWLRIGCSAGWLQAKRYKRLCAWCGKELGEDLQDNIEPLEDRGIDTHGYCDECGKKFLEDYESYKKTRQTPPIVLTAHITSNY